MRIIQFSSTSQQQEIDMVTMYVYSAEDNSLVGTIEGESNQECEKLFQKEYDMNDFYASYCQK